LLLSVIKAFIVYFITLAFTAMQSRSDSGDRISQLDLTAHQLYCCCNTDAAGSHLMSCSVCGLWWNLRWISSGVSRESPCLSQRKYAIIGACKHYTQILVW